MTFSPEMIGYVAACLTTFSFAPQVLLTLRTRDTKTISVGMYSMFITGVFLWTLYGIQKADWVIVSANAMTFLLAVPILGMKVFNLAWGSERMRQ